MWGQPGTPLFTQALVLTNAESPGTHSTHLRLPPYHRGLEKAQSKASHSNPGMERDGPGLNQCLQGQCFPTQRWASWPWSFGILNTLSSWREILQRNTEPFPCLSYVRIWPCYYKETPFTSRLILVWKIRAGPKETERCSELAAWEALPSLPPPAYGKLEKDDTADQAMARLCSQQ